MVDHLDYSNHRAGGWAEFFLKFIFFYMHRSTNLKHHSFLKAQQSLCQVVWSHWSSLYNWNVPPEITPFSAWSYSCFPFIFESFLRFVSNGKMDPQEISLGLLMCNLQLCLVLLRVKFQGWNHHHRCGSLTMDYSHHHSTSRNKKKKILFSLSQKKKKILS